MNGTNTTPQVLRKFKQGNRTMCVLREDPPLILEENFLKSYAPGHEKQLELIINHGPSPIIVL